MLGKKNILKLLLILEGSLLAVVFVSGLLFGNYRNIESKDANSVTASVAGGDGSGKMVNEDTSLLSNDDINEDEETLDRTSTGNSDQNVETAVVFSTVVEEKLAEMTLEEKVAQLFLTTPEELTGVEQVTVAGDSTKEALESYPVAGLVYSSKNFTNASQIVSMIENTQSYGQDSVALDLFTVVEEIGGEDHSPLAAAIEEEYIISPAILGAEESLDTIYDMAYTKGVYLLEHGFNTVLAPIADVSTGNNGDFDETTYGSEVVNVAECVEMDVTGTQDAGVNAIVRAFPGIQEATDDYTAYQVAIDAGVTFIQVSNLTFSELTGSDSMPCSVSGKVVTLLREDMGFDGLIMTSDLSESSVLEYCSTADAAVAAVTAGMDLLYVTDEFEEAYQAVLEAFEDGSISMISLNNSVGRILSVKLD